MKNIILKPRQLTQIQRQFPHVTYNVNKTEIKTGLQPAYSGRKLAKNQAEALSIEYCTNLANALYVAGEDPAATHVHNIQRREEDHTISRRKKYIEGILRKPGTTLVTQQQTDSSTLEITEIYH